MKNRDENEANNQPDAIENEYQRIKYTRNTVTPNSTYTTGANANRVIIINILNAIEKIDADTLITKNLEDVLGLFENLVLSD